MVRFGTELQYGTVLRLDFGKKYDTELCAEFLRNVRQGTKIRYYIFRTVWYTFRTTVMRAVHFCFEVQHFSFLRFSFLSITSPRLLPSPLTTSHLSQFQITIL